MLSKLMKSCELMGCRTGQVDVDSAIVGMYQITYTCTDRDKRQARAVRFVNVSDTTPPTITLNRTEEKGGVLYWEFGNTWTDPG